VAIFERPTRSVTHSARPALRAFGERLVTSRGKHKGASSTTGATPSRSRLAIPSRDASPSRGGASPNRDRATKFARS